MKRISPLLLALALTQTGCIVVGGYSRGGGWFLWPGGGLGVLLIIVLVLYLLRR